LFWYSRPVVLRLLITSFASSFMLRMSLRFAQSLMDFSTFFSSR
jgi:hypothetical protein